MDPSTNNLILERLALIHQEVGELRQEVGELRQEVGELRQEVGELRQEVAATNLRVDETNRRIDESRVEVRELFDERLKPMWQAVNAVRSDVQGLRADFERLEDRMVDGFSAVKGSIEALDHKVMEERSQRRVLEQKMRDLQREP